MDTTKTMREICEIEPQFEKFLQLKGFPFSLNNPIVDIVTFEDVAELQHLDKEATLAEFEKYKAGELDDSEISPVDVNPQAGLGGLA